MEVNIGALKNIDESYKNTETCLTRETVDNQLLSMIKKMDGARKA